jgi:hypothetical protein
LHIGTPACVPQDNRIEEVIFFFDGKQTLIRVDKDNTTQEPLHIPAEFATDLKKNRNEKI